MNTSFAEDVNRGLASNPKYLPSKYFYDKAGDALFVKIMDLPEYYLTNCEMEIFTEQTADMIHAFELEGRPFELFELGAGDGTKTIELIRALNPDTFTFVPIDISENALDMLASKLQIEFPDVHVECRQGDYFEILGTLQSQYKKIILFLGSNIGNLDDNEARSFICNLASKMNKNDLFLLGVDLKKNTSIILPAYDDRAGITRMFNLNLLNRINSELGGSFNLNKFSHQPVYDTERGMAISYLKSDCDQVVSVNALNRSFEFKKGEQILTEISRKYDLAAIERIIQGSGLVIKDIFYDRKKYFSDILMIKTE